jgi:hypothetical protein
MRERINARRRVEQEPKVCASCGATFMPARSDARTCSDRCRQRLRRGVRLQVPDADGSHDASDEELLSIASARLRLRQRQAEQRARERALSPQDKAAAVASRRAEADATKAINRANDALKAVESSTRELAGAAPALASVDEQKLAAKLDARITDLRDRIDVQIERLRRLSSGLSE